jgi:hypothetical protein
MRIIGANSTKKTQSLIYANNPDIFFIVQSGTRGCGGFPWAWNVKYVTSSRPTLSKIVITTFVFL